MADPLWINADAGAPQYTAAELRQAMALPLMYGGRNLGARQGVRPGGDQLRVSLAGSTITVKAGVCCIDPGLSTPQGPYWVAIPVDETHTLSPANATNPRKDIVIVRVYDHDEDASGLRLARTEYIAGVAGPSPAEPALPAGSIKLAMIDVPRAGNGNPVVTNNPPYTVAAGGILPVGSQAERDALAAYAGLHVYRTDLGWLQRYSGSSWADVTRQEGPNTWTPQLTALTTNPNLGSGGNLTQTGTWVRQGRMVYCNGRLRFGSSGASAGSGDYRISLPVPAAAALGKSGALGVGTILGTAVLRDNSNLAGSMSAGVQLVDANNVMLIAQSVVGATNPWTWATDDAITFDAVYMAD